MTAQDEREAKILSPAQQAEVLSAMRSVAEGHEPTSTPVTASAGLRWSDMHAAVIEAATEREMAVFGRQETETGLRYSIRTVDGRPVVLDITRLDDDRVYSADAAVGRFGDAVEERALLDALDRHLRRFGRKRGFKND